MAKNIKVIEQDSGLWFVYERNGVGELIHKVSVFDKGNKVAGLPNDGYQVVNWDGSPEPMVYFESPHFWSAVHEGLKMARLSCNY